MVIDGLAGLEWDHKHDQIQHKISEPGGSKSLRMGDFPWSWLITGTGIVGDAVNMVYKMILNAQVTTFWWLDTKWCNLVWFLDFRYLSFYNPFSQYQNISNTSHKPWFREWNQVFETVPWGCFSGWGREKAPILHEALTITHFLLMSFPIAMPGCYGDISVSTSYCGKLEFPWRSSTWGYNMI